MWDIALNKEGERKTMSAIAPTRVRQSLATYLFIGTSVLSFSSAARAADIWIAPPGPDGRYKVDAVIHAYPEDEYRPGGFWRRNFIQVRWQDWPGGGMRSQEIGPGDSRCSGGYRECTLSFLFNGAPGSRGKVAVQVCHKDNKSIAQEMSEGRDIRSIGKSVCSGFREYPFIIPEGRPPEVIPPTVVRIDPATYMPRRYRLVSGFDPTDKQMAVSTSGTQLRVLLHMRGSLDEIPGPQFTRWGYRPPEIRVYWRASTEGFGSTRLERVRKEGDWVPIAVDNLKRVGDAYSFEIPESALENSHCQESRCDPVDVKVDFVTGRRSPTGGKPIEDIRTEIKQITVVTRYRPTEDPLVLAARNEPAAIVSECNVTHKAEVMKFSARHSKAFGTNEEVLVDLQYVGRESLWSPSNLLTQLRQVTNSKPPEFRATLPVNQLARLSPSWRWRVKAAEGDRTGDWCYFQVAGVADTAMKPKPATLPAKSPGVQSVLSAPGALSGTNPSATASAPMVLSAPKGASGGDAGGSRQMNAPINIAPSAARAATVTPSGPSQVASLGKLQQGVSLLGGDYRSQPAVATAQSCQALCTAEAQCKAWTWVTAEKRCWLKSSVPVASKGDCCTSGVK